MVSGSKGIAEQITVALNAASQAARMTRDAAVVPTKCISWLLPLHQADHHPDRQVAEHRQILPPLERTAADPAGAGSPTALVASAGGQQKKRYREMTADRAKPERGGRNQRNIA